MTLLAQVIILLFVAVGMLGFIHTTCFALKVASEMLKRYASKLAADNCAEMERRKAANNE